MAKMKKKAKQLPERISVSSLKHFEETATSGREVKEDAIIELSQYLKKAGSAAH
jgi:hypothetical protein